MDFWEVLKVVVRRWVVTVPLVLATGAVAVLLPPTIDPSYSASISAVVITPIDNQNPANPFLALGPVTMAASLAGSGDSGAAVESAVQAGVSPTFTVNQQNSRSPIVTAEVQAATPELAVATAEFVRTALTEQLQAQQDAVSAPPEAQYYLQDLTGPVAPVPVYEGAQRVRFLAIGIGLLLTVVVAMAIEGIAVLRARRRDAAHGLSGDERERLAIIEEREALLVERERLLRARELEHSRRTGAPTDAPAQEQWRRGRFSTEVPQRRAGETDESGGGTAASVATKPR
ncbi:hypothetical protein [Jannaschia sp. R86511]|uniref:hypothetical protein n=1 Tax=Jannaschia sp. R86511 TaxID=3093853 RepID=UPI0036D309C1